MRIKALTNTATDFASDDYIVIDGNTNGSRKMAKNSVFQTTAENGYRIAGGNDLNKCVSFVGNGDTFVVAVEKMPVVAGQNFTIKVPYDWSYSMTDPTKRRFEVMYYPDSLSAGQVLFECLVDKSLPSEINLQVPNTATAESYIRFGGRATLGDKVSVFYKVNNVDLIKRSKDGYNDFAGEFYETETSVREIIKSGTSRAVSLAGLPNAAQSCVLLEGGGLSTNLNGSTTINFIPVSAGDKVQFYCGSTGYRLIIYDNNKDYLNYYGGQVTPRTVTMPSGAAYIRMSFVTASYEDVFIKVNGEFVFKPVFYTIANEIAKNGAFVPVNIIGMDKGFTTSVNQVKVLPNHKYRLHIPFPWNYHSGDNSQYRLEIDYFQDLSSAKSILKFWQMNQTLPNTYDFAVPATATNEAFVTCGGRAAYGNMETMYVEDITYNDPWNAVVNNATPDVLAVCKKGYGNASAKNYAFAVTTDSHGSTASVRDVIELANGQDCIDAVFNFGDITNNNFNETSSKTQFFAEVDGSTKPVLPVIGNHDVGLGYYVGNGCDHTQAYDTYIKPAVDKSWISAGGKCYYYKDIASQKLRIIAVYEYDSDLEIDETKWSLVAYDSSKPMISNTATYAVGDVVNVPNFTSYSFSANETIDMTGASVWNKEKYPSYKFQRGYRMIRQTQADWLCNTLISTPANYSVIILMHNPFSAVANTEPSKLFCKNVSVSAASYIQSVMDTDIFAEIINAFNNGTALNINVKYKGDASYANTLVDGEGNSYAYNLTADFSQKNSGVKFLCYFGGHTHWDAIWIHPTYTTQIQITSMEQGFQELIASDIPKDSNRIGKGGGDSILVVGIDGTNNQISLTKVGNKRTIDGRNRDFEVINL